MAWLERLFVDENPETILAVLEEVWEHWHDEDAVDDRGDVDGAGLLHFMGKREDIEEDGVTRLHAGMELDSKSRNECVFDAWWSLLAH